MISKICKVKISHRAGSTNNLHRHVRLVHPAVQLEKTRIRPAEDDGSSSDSASASASTTTSTTSSTGTSTTASTSASGSSDQACAEAVSGK